MSSERERATYWAKRVCEETKGMPCDCDHEFIGHGQKCEHCGWTSTEYGAVVCAEYILSSAREDDGREAWAREFVCKCFMELSNVIADYEPTKNRLTAELLAAAHARPDDGEPVTFDEVRAALGERKGVFYRVNSGKLVVIGLEMPCDTRGQLRNLLAALGIPQPTGEK